MVRPSLTPIILAGPTGIGKSSLAMAWARRFNGEIVCADSRQFYDFMAIGCAAPSAKDMREIPHHGFLMFDPRTQKMDAGSFVEFAHKTMADIQSRGKRPILVGGTGLYLRALAFGLNDVPKGDLNLRAQLEDECQKLGVPALYERLQNVDPETAKAILPNDRQRIVRALEIFSITGHKPSLLRQSFSGKSEVVLKAHWYLLKMPREQLLKNIEIRVESMFQAGLVDEAIALRNLLPPGHWALEVMGFKEALMAADSGIDIKKAIELVIIRHRQYAKRQCAWFNREAFYWEINLSSPRS